MKTMKWLIRREFWEHKGAFLWAPLALSGVMIFFLFITLAIGNNLKNVDFNYVHNGQDGAPATQAVHIGGDVSQAFIEKMAHIVGDNYMWFSTPIFIMAALIIFFYCLNALYDERRDRSILFWKSLPISDSMTVVSKIAMALVGVPLITIGVAFLTSLLGLLMGCIALSIRGINVFGLVFTTPAVYLAPFEILGVLPVYLLWALPTVGWLLMVSCWARSKVFLWAVGIPLLSIVLLLWAEKMFRFGLDIGWYTKNIVARLLFSVVPGGWMHIAMNGEDQALNLGHGGMDLTKLLEQSWTALGNIELWVGAVAGVIMIGIAIYLRRWREEN
jgi:ABC-2 type transport system permease protein